MKNFWLVLLMFVFPLQAALAAVQAYHGHGPEGKATIESALHTHHDHGHHDEPSANENIADQSGKSPCEGDHHHCHAHSVTVLPSFCSFDVPPSALAHIFEHQKGYQSCLFNRIERPKWV